MNISTYKARLFRRTYFSLIQGYTYHLGDTVFFQKCVLFPENFEFRIISILTGKEYPLTFKSKKIIDLSDKKFYELNGSIVTDYFIPDTPSIYLAELRSGNEIFYDIFFVNVPWDPANIRINIILSNYTWTAYNTFGGRSHYKDIVTPFIVRLFKNYHQSRYKKYLLNLFKPNELNNKEIMEWLNDQKVIKPGKNYHSVVAELPLICYLWNKYEGKIQIMDCHEFENYQGPRENRVFVFNGHSEYWSDRMIGQLQNLKRKNNILFFSGNNMYRKVKVENKSIFVTENLINPEITARITGLSSTRDGLGDNSSYLVINPDHFLFKNIKCKEIGGPWVVSNEADVIHSFTPPETEVLAVGKTRPCDLILIPQENGNYLMNFGSIGAFHGMTDSCFVQLLDNFLEFAVTPRK